MTTHPPRIILASVLALIASLAFGTAVHAEPEPLSSWNDGPAKKAIVDFVQKTTDKSARILYRAGVPADARAADLSAIQRFQDRHRLP
jgi:hypothetical protein